VTCTEGPLSLTSPLDFQMVFMGGFSNMTNLATLHGSSEVPPPPPPRYISSKQIEGDKLELCSQMKYPQNYRFLDFVACNDNSVEDVPKFAAQCANVAQMDFDAIQRCSRGQVRFRRGGDGGAEGRQYADALLRRHFIYSLSQFDAIGKGEGEGA
jgi:hypothetical protein